MEVEVAIRLLYMLGEALPASHGAHFSGDTAKTSALQDMMRTVSHVTALSVRCVRPSVCAAFKRLFFFSVSSAGVL